VTKKNLLTNTLITVVLLIGLAGAASAASVTVAASNSQVKSSAQYICNGSNDQTDIQAAIDMVTSSGGDVILLDGTFNLNGDVKLAQGVNLIGAGAGTTTLNFIGEGWVKVDGSNTVRDLQSTGATGFLIIGSHVKMTKVTVKDYTAKSGAFHIYANNKVLTDFVFTNCNAIDGWSFGFLNMGEGSPNSISDITYSGCTAINCGRASQFNPWITGFDFVEGTDINNLLVENCRAEGSWESGFHFEESPRKTDIILRNCVSINNGQKKNPIYGAGFIGGSPTLQYIDCTSEGNRVGFKLGNGATATRCKDIGSTNGFQTTDNPNIVLIDCESDQAGQGTVSGINFHDVTVTSPVDNPSQVPVALFKAGVTSGKAPLTVLFSDLSTRNPTSWSWNFGDGSPTTTDRNASHVYVKTGTYVVSLTASNVFGSGTTSQTITVTTPMTSGSPLGDALQNLNYDRIYENINGNGILDINDVVVFFKRMNWTADNELIGAFDFNKNGQIDFNDIVTLFNEFKESQWNILSKFR
jgi:PKD repeat protein